MSDIRPDLIVMVGEDRYGLSWDGSAVHVHQKVKHAIYQSETTAAVTHEWLPLTTGALPVEVASVISGYCSHKMAREAAAKAAELGTDFPQWMADGAGGMNRHYGPSKIR